MDTKPDRRDKDKNPDLRYTQHLVPSTNKNKPKTAIGTAKTQQKGSDEIQT